MSRILRRALLAPEIVCPLNLLPVLVCSEGGRDHGTFIGTASIHGGQETTIITELVPLLHLGMVFVGTPYGQNPQLLTADEIGGSPYGPCTLAGADGSRQPVEEELATARNLGRRLAQVAGCLKELRKSAAQGVQAEAQYKAG